MADVALVDDEALVTQVSQKMLASASIASRRFQTFQEFTSSLASCTPQIVIMDFSLLREAGAEAVHRVEQLARELPLVLTSGYTENEVHTAFPWPEHFLFLKKPFTRDELLRCVEACLKTRSAS
jgi:DNA-binding NtrC family response regulator